MALPFENRNYLLALGNIFREQDYHKSTGVWQYLFHGKTTDTFLWLKIRLPQTLSLLAKTYAAGRANNTELLMLVSDFKVNARLKNTQTDFPWNPWNALNEDA